MNVRLTSVPVHSNNVRARVETFGMLLVSARTPVLTLNDDSAAIWSRIDGERSVAAIVEDLQDEYDCPVIELEAAVVSFLDSCGQLGLIEFQ